MILLADMLKKADLEAEAGALCLPFRKRFGLPAVEQLGLVVPDVAKAAARLEKLGIAPFFMAQGPVARWQERGEDRRFCGKLGLTYHRGLELELLEPGQGSDFYTKSLSADGEVAVQHLGFLVDNVDAWEKKLTLSGSPAIVRGRIAAGPLRVEFAYMDTQKDLGLIVEFIAFYFLGKRVKPLPALVRALGRLQKKSGRRCFRI